MLARAERFGWYNAWKDEECAEGEKRSWEKLFRKRGVKNPEHASLVVYIFVELRIKRALSLSLSLFLSVCFSTHRLHIILSGAAGIGLCNHASKVSHDGGRNFIPQ